MKTLDHVEVTGRKVLIRVDFNVPVNDGKVINDARVRHSLPTISELIDKGASLIIISHMGRPSGKKRASLSLKPLVPILQEQLPGIDVTFSPDVIGKEVQQIVANMSPRQVLLLENLRFEIGEEQNDSDLASILASYADLFVNDAFSCSHRKHASVAAITSLLPSVAGRLMEKEIKMLSDGLDNPIKPIAAVIGGSKISTKIGLLRSLVKKMDYLVIGGAMANTFFSARGLSIGKSLFERDMEDTAREILADASLSGCEIVLPEDGLGAEGLTGPIEVQTIMTTAIPNDMMLMDIGPKTIESLGKLFNKCNTVIWNGPMGVFEVKPFNKGTESVAVALASLTQSGAIASIAGGGDTVAALEQAQVVDSFSYVSMAGGAFLEWLEGRPLPGLAVLEK